MAITVYLIRHAEAEGNLTEDIILGRSNHTPPAFYVLLLTTYCLLQTTHYLPNIFFPFSITLPKYAS